MAPAFPVRYSLRGAEAVPHYLTEKDHPWLRALLDEYDRFVGRPRRELDDRLRDPLPVATPPAMARLARHVLDRMYSSRCEAAVPPPDARRAVFDAAARGGAAPHVTLRDVAAELRVPVEALRESLLADIPGERRLRPPGRALSASQLALHANLALVRAILCGSSRVRIRAQGNARAVVRHAKLRGLICSISARARAGDAGLEISGPFILFRRTLLYGRALAELVPLLAWCDRYEMECESELHGRTRRFVFRSGDPIMPASEPRQYDSRLEERFARDFRRAAPDYDVIRDPEPIEVCGTHIFPDFALEHRRDRSKRFLIEIIGFWTASYLATKLARLRAARIPNLILCVDEERNCGENDFPPAATVIRFRRRIDPAVVLRALAMGRPAAVPAH